MSRLDEYLNTTAHDMWGDVKGMPGTIAADVGNAYWEKVMGWYVHGHRQTMEASHSDGKSEFSFTQNEENYSMMFEMEAAYAEQEMETQQPEISIDVDMEK